MNKKIIFIILITLNIFLISCSQLEEETGEDEGLIVPMFLANLEVENKSSEKFSCAYVCMDIDVTTDSVNYLRNVYGVVPESYLPDNHQEIWKEYQKNKTFRSEIKPIYTKNNKPMDVYYSSLNNFNFDVLSNSKNNIYLFGCVLGSGYGCLSTCQLQITFQNGKKININGWDKNLYNKSSDNDVFDLGLFSFSIRRVFSNVVNSVYQVTVVVSGDNTSDVEIIKNPTFFR